MRLRLEDNGSPNTITFDRSPRGRRGGRGNKLRLLPPRGDGRAIAIYNPNTGIGTVLNDGVALSGLFKNLKKKIKAKKELRAKKQAVKQEQKLARYTNRQEAKTSRQAGRQDRKMTRIKGKQDVIKARYDKKINKQGEREREFQIDSQQPTYQEESDQLPQGAYDQQAGGEYMAVDANQQYSEQPNEEEEYAEYEEVNEEEEEPEYEEEYVNDPYGGMQDGVPLNGWVDGAFNLVKKGVDAIAGSKAGQAVKQSVINKADYDRLKSESENLRKQYEAIKKDNLIYGAGGLALGTGIGILIGRATKK